MVVKPQHIVILRHGETESSSRGLYTSRTDVSLSAAGREQAEAWAGTFSDLSTYAVMCSPLVRAVETARLSGLPDFEECADLVEWDLGVLEGRSAEEHRDKSPNWNLFRDGPPDESGEGVSLVRSRASRLALRCLESESEVLILVGHGQFSRVLVLTLLGWDIAMAARMSWGPARAALLTLRGGGSYYSLTGWNRSPAPWDALTTGNM